MDGPVTIGGHRATAATTPRPPPMRCATFWAKALTQKATLSEIEAIRRGASRE